MVHLPCSRQPLIVCAVEALRTDQAGVGVYAFRAGHNRLAAVRALGTVILQKFDAAAGTKTRLNHVSALPGPNSAPELRSRAEGRATLHCIRITFVLLLSFFRRSFCVAFVLCLHHIASLR